MPNNLIHTSLIWRQARLTTWKCLLKKENPSLDMWCLERGREAGSALCPVEGDLVQSIYISCTNTDNQFHICCLTFHISSQIEWGSYPTQAPPPPPPPHHVRWVGRASVSYLHTTNYIYCPISISICIYSISIYFLSAVEMF